MTQATTHRFFFTGGTLPHDAPSYIERQADTDLFQGLRDGEFCYVLDTRQMGKSSLMVRTAHRLRAAGYATALLDLTAVGYNVSPVQWYRGLLLLLGEQLGNAAELEACWREHADVGPLQRWLTTLASAVIQSELPLVVFVDEIDAVRNLPFPTDEFFAGIRECYNRRAQNPTYSRLTFCLLGVAAPTDLIREPRVSPFNIGRRIVLSDFTAEEAAPLASGLHLMLAPGGSGPSLPLSTGQREVLERVLYWTGGHPYMTQRLCRTVEEHAATSGVFPTVAEVDRQCARLFFTQEARQADDTLSFARNRLLDNERQQTNVLTLYNRIRSGKRIAVDETDPLHSTLRLAGVARVSEGALTVRNRIFERIFDRAWVRENMPDGEVRRQRAAFYTGLLRAATVGGLIVAVVGGLAYANYRTAQRALRAESRARTEADFSAQLAYDADIGLTAAHYANADVPAARQMLEQTTPSPGQPDRRGFEWHYLHQLCHNFLYDLKSSAGTVMATTFSPDGKTLVSLGTDSYARFWDVASGQLRRCVKFAAYSVALSPDGKLLALGGDEHAKAVSVRDFATLHERRTLGGFRDKITGLAYSRDGGLLAAVSNDGTAHIWETRTWRELRRMTVSVEHGFWTVAFSPDGKMLATGDHGGAARLWDVRTGRQLRILKQHTMYVYTLAFSPDGKTLATGSGDATAILWDVASGTPRHTLQGHTSYIYTLAFSPDGKRLATGAWDKAVRIWDVATGALNQLRPVNFQVWTLAHAPHSAVLAIGGNEDQLHLVDTEDPPEARIRQSGWIQNTVFSPDGRYFAAKSVDNHIRIWQVAAARCIRVLNFQPGTIGILFSEDSQRFIAVHYDGSSTEWNVTDGKATAGAHFLTTNLEATEENASAILKQCPLPVARRRYSGMEPPYQYATLSPDGTLVAFLNPKEEWIYLRETKSGQIHALERSLHVNHVRQIMFSPDSRRIAYAAGNKAYVWDIAEGKLRQVLTGHTGEALYLAFSSDGQRIATGNMDGTAKVWDAITGRELLSFKGCPEGIWVVAFSPDGQHLLGGGADGNLRFWEAPR